MRIDRNFTLSTLQSLVRIDSRNPGLEAGAPGEGELATYVQNVLRDIGWDVAHHDLGSGRANVVARRKGTGQGPSLLINVHLDTVGVAGMTVPFSGELRDGRIWGRGAQDTKGGMAAVLGMARALSQGDIDLGGDLVLAFVADEEDKSIGTADLIRRVKTDAAIVIEPSDLDVCIAHRGFGIFRVRTHGKTAHGGQSDIGIDANMHMGHVLAELDSLREAWHGGRRHVLLGSPSLHVPLISGGRQLFIYAAECAADVECRTVPGQSETNVTGELRAVLDAVGKRIEGFRGSVEPVLWRAPYEIDTGRPIVRTVLAAVESVREKPARTIGHSWWEDSGLLGEAGIDTVVLGPVGEGLHTEEEWVDADSVIDLGEILHNTALSFCAGS